MLKFQMVPQILNILWVQEKGAQIIHMSEARASYSQRTWAEDSSSASHLRHKGLLVSPIK